MQMLEEPSTVCHSRKALNLFEGIHCSRLTGLTITAYLPSISSTYLAQQCRDVKLMSVSSGAYLLSCFLGILESKSEEALQRSKAQFGVAPHLCTNFRVSRTPNRSTALPWQRLTAKSTVYHLIGPQIISHCYTQPIIAVFFQHGTFRQALNLCFQPVRHLTLFTQHRGNAVTSVQH